jgi:phosphatidylserine/phosphatidylglycerophosphate/cardiolipin synthase-like enzyme/uncharacterized membrane protein YdjX (TVP38/TMEM64 family)
VKRSYPILQPGENCWRLAPASRVAFLIDGAPYFRTLADAIDRAERSIWLVGWDFHTRICLRRDGDEEDPSDCLVERLEAALRRRPALRVHVLEWDFAVIYAAERELLPLLRFGFQTQQRLAFRLDSSHPLGGSHHQKIAVIDGALAFAGGIDLAAGRWDTPEHAKEDPRRNDPGLGAYPPFHDVQVAVDGAAAGALAELVQERWRRATGRRLPAPPTSGDPWPAELAPDLRDVEVAVARTEPAHDGRSEVREVERLYLDSIRAARSWIYLENQYFTSDSVGQALCERLQEEDGPEVVIVLPASSGGWLEETTMGVLRARLVKRLQDADRHGRLRLLHPRLPGVEDESLTVHAKVCIVDGELARIGSANLANRSMGLDTECDLAIESRGSPETTAGIVGLRNRLLGEHLDVPAPRVDALNRETGSLVRTLDELAGGERTLAPLDASVPDWLDALVPSSAVLDPEGPVDFATLRDQFLDLEEAPVPSRRAMRIAGVALVLVGIALAWRFTPLGDMVTPERLVEAASGLRTQPGGPALAVAAFALASLLMVPVNGLIVATCAVFGAGLGAALSLAGALASASIAYALGGALWRDAIRRLAGRRLNQLSERLGHRGILSTATVRLVPVAPFTVVNLVAGASHVGPRDFLLGTLLGLTPGVLALSLAADRAVAAITDPDATSVAVALLVVILVVAGGALLRRRLQKADDGGEE